MELVLDVAVTTLTVMKNVLLPIYIGLLLANICAAGAFEGLGSKWLPAIARFTGLSTDCAGSVLLSIGDRMAGMAALMVVKRQAELSDGEVIAANIVAKAPSVIQMFLFSFIPIMAGMFPDSVTIRFLLLYFIVFLCISCIGIVYARLVGGSGRRKGVLSPAPERRLGWKEIFYCGIKETWYPFWRIIAWMVGMSFIAILVARMGFINGLVAYLPIDPTFIPVAVVGLISMLGGVAAVGVAYHDGMISAQAIVPLLFSISILHNTYDLFSSSLPRTLAVFGQLLGWKVAIAGFLVTQAVMVLMLGLIQAGIV